MIDDGLRGPTPPRPRRDTTGPVSITDDTTRRISPAETSQVTEIVTALMGQLVGHVGEIVESKVLAALPPRSEDTISMRRSTRTGYRGVIGALAAGLVAAVTWGVAQVEAYGDGRADAARSALAAEAKAAEAERSAIATAKLAEETAERVDRLESKIDLVLAKLKERP